MTGAVRPSDVGVHPKPSYGDVCNGCGVCCRTSLCAIAFALGIDRQVTNCPLQKLRDGRIVCGAILLEAAYVADHPGAKPFIGEFLGTGLGCCLLIFGYEGDNDLPIDVISSHMLKVSDNKRQFRETVAMTYGTDKSLQEIQEILLSRIKEYAAYAEKIFGESIEQISTQALSKLSRA